MIVERKFNPSRFLNKLSLYCLIVITFTPYAIRNMPRLLQISALILWFISALGSGIFSLNNKRFHNLFFLIATWQVYEILIKIIGLSTAEWGNYFMKLLSYSSILIGFCVKEKYSYNEKYSLTIFSTLVILVNLIHNIIISRIYPQAHLGINSTWGVQYLRTNTAQTSFYALICFFLAFVFCSIINEKNKLFIKNVTILIAMYFLFTVAPRATVCAFTLIFIVVAINLKINNNNISNSILAFILILIASMFLLEPFLEFAVNSLNLPERLEVRVTAILSILKNDSTVSQETVTARSNLSLLSLKTFSNNLNNFFIGVGYHAASDSFSVGVGQHSSLIDVLAEYGIIGATFLYSIIHNSIKMFTQYEEDGYQLYYKLFFGLFIIYGILNLFIMPEIMYGVFVVGMNMHYDKNEQDFDY